jgi:hypothetical protein
MLMHFALKTCEIALLPIHFFFHFLYYTDTASTFWVLAMIYAAGAKKHTIAAMVSKQIYRQHSNNKNILTSCFLRLMV